MIFDTKEVTATQRATNDASDAGAPGEQAFVHLAQHLAALAGRLTWLKLSGSVFEASRTRQGDVGSSLLGEALAPLRLLRGLELDGALMSKGQFAALAPHLTDLAKLQWLDVRGLVLHEDGEPAYQHEELQVASVSMVSADWAKLAPLCPGSAEVGVDLQCDAA